MIIAVQQRSEVLQVHLKFGDQRYWNVRAEIMRVPAEDVADAEIKVTLLRVADSNQRLPGHTSQLKDRLADPGCFEQAVVEARPSP